MLILVGPSASGKTEIAKTLVKHFHFKKIITTTTRDKRLHETDGLDYHFLDKESFLKLKHDKAFLETSVYQNHFYGLQKKDVLPFGIVILDPQGANDIYLATNKKCFIIWIQTSHSVRKTRMIARGDSEKNRSDRLGSDDAIFNKSTLRHIDYECLNDDIDVMKAALACQKEYVLFLNTLNHT